jgi:hypothetical protein
MTPQELKTKINSGFYADNILQFNIDLPEAFNLEYNTRADDAVNLAYDEAKVSVASNLINVFDYFEKHSELLQASEMYTASVNDVDNTLIVTGVTDILPVGTEVVFSGTLPPELNENCTYFIRQSAGVEYAIFTSLEDAQGNTNQITFATFAGNFNMEAMI